MRLTSGTRPDGADVGITNVPTLDGSASIEIPPGIQPGSVLRLKGKGLPEFGSVRHGELYLRHLLLKNESSMSGCEPSASRRLKLRRATCGKGTDLMLSKPHIRRSISALLMTTGAVMMYLAIETWAGTLLLVLGVALEAVGIALKR